MKKLILYCFIALLTSSSFAVNTVTQKSTEMTKSELSAFMKYNESTAYMLGAFRSWVDGVINIPTIGHTDYLEIIIWTDGVNYWETSSVQPGNRPYIVTTGAITIAPNLAKVFGDSDITAYDGSGSVVRTIAGGNYSY